jgi:hypothetical protein
MAGRSHQTQRLDSRVSMDAEPTISLPSDLSSFPWSGKESSFLQDADNIVSCDLSPL